MRTRNIKKQVWLNREEATLLKKKAKKVGLNESELIRNFIIGFEPREKPDDRFYEVMKLHAKQTHLTLLIIHYIKKKPINGISLC